MAGIIESRKGNIQTTIEHLQKAARLDPKNLKILYALAEKLEQEAPQKNATQIKELFENILEQYPNNLPVLLEKIRTAGKCDKKTRLKKSLQKLDKLSENWPDQMQKQYREQQAGIATQYPHSGAPFST